MFFGSARDTTDIAKQLSLDETTARLTLAKAKGKMLAARKPRPTPFIDKTMYVSWNAMSVSAYLDAARVLGGSLGASCRTFALKTLDRMLKEVWTEARGFGHRIGGPALEGSLDDQVFCVLALLDAYEATRDPRYFAAAQKPWTSPSPATATRRRRLLRSPLRRRTDGRPRHPP